MKIGLRKPSIKKRVKARTTAKLKRKVKGTINPLYGKKGMGWINDPKRALYNKVYNKTTFSVDDVIDSCTTIPNFNNSNSSTESVSNVPEYNEKTGVSIFKIILIVVFLPLVLIYYFFKLIIKCFVK